MPSTVRPKAHQNLRHNQTARRLICRHLILLFFLVSLAALLLPSVYVGAPIELRRTAARVGISRPARLTKSGYNKSSKRQGDLRGAIFGVGNDDLTGELNTGPISAINFLSDASQQAPSGTEYTAGVRSDHDQRSHKPKEGHLIKAHSFDGDLRDLPYRKPIKRERPERQEPEPNPTMYSGTAETRTATGPTAPAIKAPAPSPSASFDGLDFANWGDGHPPDTNGDVGPTYYIQTVNTSIGVFRKSDGVRVAAFTYDTFMSQGNFGNLCDTDNFGDPVVLYDSFEDRWIITDFAFKLDGSGTVVNPPGAFQCFAASKTGDPVSGGWNFYSINTQGGLGDYPKFGIWPDGLYMSVNMFDYAAAGSFQNPRVYALNKAQMYAGAPTVQSVSFDASASDFTVLPSNARLQTGTPPPGTPNYFVSTWQFLNGLAVYKFHVDWNSISLSAFTGPDVPIASSSWPNASVPNAPSLGGNSLDVLEIRAMMQNQYSNIGGVESLWTTHTVRRENTSGFAAPRWYQTNVSGGVVAANLPQASTWDPDAANVIYRFLPSLAVDRIGDMALGYSTSSSTTKPAIKYAGRLATDPVNTLGQTEQLLIQGSGTQTGNCGGSPCTRWGDYSAMSLDPNGCTFWYTNEYYAVDGLNDLTRIGSFAFPQCTPLGSGGTLSGTVTDSLTSNPINGATVQLGSRTTSTNASGFYSFTNLPAGIYPSVTAGSAGHNSSTATSIVVTDGATTTQNFSLSAAPLSACFVDTSQADFETGVATNVDVTTSPGDVTLFAPSNVDQQNLTVTANGFSFTSTSWAGQTFTAAVSGSLTRVDLDLFCSSCTGTTPDLTVSIRATSGNVPTGADLAVTTIQGFSSGSGGYFSANFSTPAILTAGTKYAVIIRASANPSAGNYAYVCSCGAPNSNPYSDGQRVTSANSGSTWSSDNTAGGRDLGFITYIKSVFSSSGNLISAARDANPPAGLVPHWTTLSWTAAVPANTAIKFQGAASNSVDGPFNFVGPDGTVATFFTNGASLAQFNGLRYLKYKALLSTSDTTVTPTLHDVTACFSDGTPTITAAAPLIRQQGTNVNSQIATVSDPSQAANTLNVTASPLTGSGVTINNISVDVAGKVTADVAANCVATNSTFNLTVTNSSSATATDTLTVNVTPNTPPTITPGGPTTFCAGGSVTLTSSSAGGNQWNLNGNPIGGATNQQYIATASGNYTVSIPQNSCTLTSAATTVTVNPVPATPTITPGGPTTFCNGGSVTLTSSSASGNQWYLNGNPIGGATNQQYVATAAGSYTTIVTSGGCSSAPSAPTAVTVNPTPATPTIVAGGPTTFCNGGSVTLTSSSVSGNQWYLNGNPIGGATNQQYIATAAGSYTTIVTSGGCSSTPSNPTTVTVNPVPPTPTITPGGATTFCEGGSVTLTSSSASGNQWYLNGNPIGGATNQQFVATATGNYTTIVTSSGCSSAPSASTVVTVNPAPPKPTITPGGATTFCEGGSVTLTSSSASGNQWYLNGNPIGGATNQQFVVTASGNYTTIVTSGGCSSVASNPTAVTVTPTPATPTIAAGGATTFCNGGSVTLTSSSASGNQWYLNGNPIGGATNQQYIATTSGNYTTIVTTNGCSSAPSAPTTVTVNPVPATPTITPGGPTTFFEGGSVTLTSSSASGNQWYLNSNPIGGATAQQYVATASGNYTVTVTTGGCTSSPSAATTVTVNPPPVSPTITKSFSPTSVPLNASSTLSFTIANPNTTTGLSGVGFVDNLPAGVVVAATPNVTGSCGSGTITATAGSSGVSLSGATLTASPAIASACTFTVAVTGTTAGTKLNTTSAIISTETGTGSTSNTATLTVVAPPAITKSFTPTNIAPGGITTLTINVSNPGANTVQLNGLAFTDNFPANLVVANPNGLTNTCGGTPTATAGSGVVSLTGGTIPINGSCSLTVKVTSSVAGVYVNNSNAVSSTNGGTGNSASATLNVNAPPTISKIFAPGTVVQNGSAVLNFTLSNPNTHVSLTGIGFTDNLPAGLVVDLPNGLSNGCGGTPTAVAGSSSISLSAGSLGPSTTCTISVKVKAPANSGTLNNTTGPISANESGSGATSNTASLIVVAALPPTIAKSFGVASIPLNGITSLTFTLANPNTTFTLTNVSAIDTLPTGLVVATPNNLTGNCTANITANAGSNTIGITALNLAASASCSFSVSVKGTSAGPKNNVSGNVSATYDPGSGPVLITGGTASASVTVLKGDQTITFASLPNRVFGDVDFVVSPNASSGLPVSLAATGNCSVTSPSPGTVHLTGSGSCTITASQAGDGNYNAATNVPQSFNISQAGTTTLVSTSINPSDIGQNVLFTAVVTAGATTNSPTGTVQFKDGVNNLGAAVNCIAGIGNTCTAQFLTSALLTGTHAISAVYSGDTNFSGGSGLLAGGQVVTNQPTLLLILEELGPISNQATALDSLLHLRDPFSIQNIATWFYSSADHNTRLVVFVGNLQLDPGEPSSAVVVNLIDSHNQSFDVPAEDVRTEPITGFSQVTFRLPDTLFSGDCKVQVKWHGHISNDAIIRIAP